MMLSRYPLPDSWQPREVWMCAALVLLLLASIAFLVHLRRKYKGEIDARVKAQIKSIEEQKTELLRVNEELNDYNHNSAIINEVLKSESDYLKVMNQKIISQKEEIVLQSMAINRKNIQLTQSLKYAKRIQNSLLPTKDELLMLLPKSAIFFQPRDIVSGDFYWLRTVGRKVIFAEVDCTGHGVPGAFMSMIGNTLLNEIVVSRGITRPAEIFLSLNAELSCIFSRNDFDVEDQDEGMDLTLAVYDRDAGSLEIASAMQNFFVIAGDKVTVYKGDIFSIGGLISRIKKPVYKTHSFVVNAGFRVVICSDGFIDQFGSGANDKFGVDRFVSLLEKSRQETVEGQIEAVRDEFFTWKDAQEQLDDVLIMIVEF